MKNDTFLPEQKSRTAPIRRADLRVLFTIRKGINSVTMISKEIGRGKSSVSERLGKLVKQELVKKKDSLFYLTTPGKMACSALAGLPCNKPIVFRLHKYTSSAPFLRKSAELEAQLASDKRFSRNYCFDRAKFNAKYDSVTVQFHPNSVSFVLPPVYSPDLIIAEAYAVRLLNAVIDLLEQDFPGTKIGVPKVTSHLDDNHIAVVNHPLSIEFAKFRENFGETYCFKGDKIEVDFSDGSVELECVDKLNAKEDCYKLARFCNLLVTGDNFKKFEALLQNLDSFGNIEK
ncbi:MAG: helix-turn-helix domain-containing protein [Candidatus Diapherotrites archaeon]